MSRATFMRGTIRGAVKAWSATACATAFAALCILTAAQPSLAQDRFPQPQFQGGYSLPSTEFPAGRPISREYADVAVLAIGLGLAALIALRIRSRPLMFALMAANLVYFGFFRKGCICPIGAIQNVSLALANPGFAVSIPTVLMFTLPLAAALLFGRVFCAGVCPLGAIQDIVLIRPVTIAPPVERSLRLLVYLAFGAAVLFPLFELGFIICRLDPFVGVFRRSATIGMTIFGVVMLLIATVVARPYCRFFCPYSVPLAWMSRLSVRHATITPDECIDCRLCEPSCPFGAILAPRPTLSGETRTAARRRMLRFTLLLPLWIIAGAAVGYAAGAPLGLFHRDISLSARIAREDQTTGMPMSVESSTYRTGNQPLEALEVRAVSARRRVRRAGALLGAWFGLAVGAALLALTLERPRAHYTPDKSTCLSCARCFASCPREHRRRTGART